MYYLIDFFVQNKLIEEKNLCILFFLIVQARGKKGKSCRKKGTLQCQINFWELLVFEITRNKHLPPSQQTSMCWGQSKGEDQCNPCKVRGMCAVYNPLTGGTEVNDLDDRSSVMPEESDGPPEMIEYPKVQEDMRENKCGKKCRKKKEKIKKCKLKKGKSYKSKTCKKLRAKESKKKNKKKKSKKEKKKKKRKKTKKEKSKRTTKKKKCKKGKKGRKCRSKKQKE